MDNQSMVYMAYDGDNAGRLCGRAILADNPDALHEVSERIQLGHEVVRRWVESHGGQFISGGGDEGVFSIPAEAIPSVEELRADYKFATNLTATIGIGNTLSEAGKAMLVGKFRGKNTTVQYDPSIEQEIKGAQSRTSAGTASDEENKINEAYLQDEGTVSNMINNKAEGANSSNDNIPNQSHDDCPYCADLKTTNTEDPNHCKYCHDMDAESDCPYCDDATANMGSSAAGDDCPYCQQSSSNDGCPYCQDAGGPSSSQDVQPTAGPTVKNPTTTDSENYAGQDLNTPDIPKPDPIQQNPDGLGTTMDVPTNENVKLDAQGQGSQEASSKPGAENEVAQTSQGIDPQSEETVQGIAQEIEAQPSTQNPEVQVANQVDAANTATGTRMQDNVSRPEDYDDQNHPSDMGLGEEEGAAPDITGVMAEGLDSHSDNINREKVINLVSEALVGFKACKGILEKAKMQAPQLYESSIAMLKAMIEMAKMLGLDQEAQTPTGEDPLADDPAAATPNSPIQDSSSQNSAQGSVDPNSGKAQGDLSAGRPKYQQADSKSPAAQEDAAPIPKQKGQ